MEIFRSLGAARSAAVAEMNLGVKAYAQGRWREATELYGNALKEFERVGDTTQAAHAAANLGEVLISRQLLDEAEAVLNEADATLRASGYRLAAMFTETAARTRRDREGGPVPCRRDPDRPRGGGT